MYIALKIPNKSHGFNRSDLEYITGTILEWVNASGINLELTRQIYKDYFRNSYYVINSYEPGMIEMEINSFKLGVIKSPYAIRELFRKLRIKIVEI